MSSEDLLEDPYGALGVPVDADISAIRSAHRKLVLKYHPDRIKDEAERERGRTLFEKVQHAYELLSDPVRRERHDDKVKLAHLRKETMRTRDREPPIVRTAPYPSRPPPTPRSEFRDERPVFGDRPPPPRDYFGFEERPRYREEESGRPTSRKNDEYVSRKSAAKEEKKHSKWDERLANGIPIVVGLGLKVKAERARTVVREREKEREREREREDRAASAKMRDRAERHERAEKHSSRRSYAGVDSDSDSDAGTYVSRASTARPSSKHGYESPQRSRAKPELPRRKTTSAARHEEESDEDYDDKWRSKHDFASEYLRKQSEYVDKDRAPKPSLPRATSYSYRDYPEEPVRRSGSDSDRRPQSSKGRRPSIDVQKTRPGRPATLSSHNSAPVEKLADMISKEGKRAPQRSSTGASGAKDHKEPPSMHRSHTMPSKPRKSDAAPLKGSNLKHTETHDSGYGSSGGHTPEMRGQSPPPTRTKYQIVDPDDEDDGSTIIAADRGDRDHRRRSSPPRDRDRRERPERPFINTESRSKSARDPYTASPVDMERPSLPFRPESASRTSLPRSSSPRDSPNSSRPSSKRGETLPYEVERDFMYPVSREKVRQSPRVDKRDVKYAKYPSHSTDESEPDYFSSFPKNHREALRSPNGHGGHGRRGSVL